MPIHLECLSHTPLHGYVDPAPEVVTEVARVQAAARERVRAFSPELIVIFAPDHFNGFFYDVMPPFCIGAAAYAIGDFKSLAGPLPVPTDLATALAQAVLDADVDVSLSYRMQVDHGCADALEALHDGPPHLRRLRFLADHLAGQARPEAGDLASRRRPGWATGHMPGCSTTRRTGWISPRARWAST